MKNTRTKLGVLSIALSGVIGLAACSSPAESDGASPDGGQSEFETVTPDVLTVATGEPAYSPWVEDDDPESGNGFEAAVAYAIAEELGFDESQVEWVRTPFDAAIAPGPKSFDLNIQQFSDTEERRQAVDFSSPYYRTSQAVVTTTTSDAADVSSLDELAAVDIGVAAGASTLNTITEAVNPTNAPQVFNSVEDAVQALRAGQIDAVATDLPGAFAIAYGGQLDDSGTLIGQIDDEEGDELSVLLPKDSSLTQPVTDAVDALRADGTLDELAATWIEDQANVPVLQ